jgi:hypothetical protein
VQSRIGGYFNKSAFCAPPTIGNGTGWGNSKIGVVRGPDENNFDISLQKSTTVGGLREDAKLVFRAEFYNAFNHPQFNAPGATVGTEGGSTPTSAFLNVASPAFGQITSMAVNPRLVQFGLKYVF